MMYVRLFLEKYILQGIDQVYTVYFRNQKSIADGALIFLLYHIFLKSWKFIRFLRYESERQLFKERQIHRIQLFCLTLVRLFPPTRRVLQKQKDKVALTITHEAEERRKNLKKYDTLPTNGRKDEEILKELGISSALVATTKTDLWQKGKVSGAVYADIPSSNSLLLTVIDKFFWSNPLHGDLFPQVQQMEADIISMVSRLFHAPTSYGVISSGGTESIFLACKAYRDSKRTSRQDRNCYDIVMPVTAHAAFYKAAEILQCNIVLVPIDPHSGVVKVSDIRARISPKTMMIVASAPNFPHGIMDPIKEISELALQHRIPLHVDSCLGGFLIPFMKDAGYELPLFDFQLPGVTSISCDTHKYGLAPKGSSVLLYRHLSHLHAQYFVCERWTGGIYATPTLSGSRSGAIIAGCWAALQSTGKSGYVKATKEIVETTLALKKGITAIDGLHVIGNPLINVVAFASNHIDIFQVGTEMSRLGYSLNELQYPPSLHICVTRHHVKHYQTLLSDLKTIVATLYRQQERSGSKKTLSVAMAAAIYGSGAKVNVDPNVIGELARVYMDTALKVDPKTHRDE